MNSQEIQEERKKAGNGKKSLFCKVILTMAVTYFLILALLFLAGSIFSGKITGILSPYYGADENLTILFNGFAMTGAVLYFISSTGILLFMMKRKAGFYIFFLPLL